MANEDDKDVIVTLDDISSGGQPDAPKSGAEGGDKGKPDGLGAVPDKEKPLTAEEGKEDLAAQLKAMEETAQSERLKREAAEREAAQARDEVKRSQGDVVAHRTQVIAGAIETVGLERTQAKAALKAAMEAGDYDAAADAQERIADSAAKLVRLQEAKAVLDANKGKPAPTHEGRVERKPAAGQDDAFEQAVASLSPASQAWARRNPQCFTDPATYRKVLAAHYAAVAEDVAPDTPSYFSYLEERVGLRQKPAADTPDDTRRPGPRPSAPVGREPAGGNGSRLQGNRITLTAAERDAARISGLTDEEYARQLVKLERSGELSAAAR